jgi:acyl carrier protein
LAQLWQDILKVERVGRRDDFFELGGHSLLAMQLIVRIRSIMALEIPIRALFEAATLEQLAAELESVRETNLLRDLAGGEEDVDELLESIAAMPESQVREMVRELEMGGRQ